jgi:hypothetical protein
MGRLIAVIVAVVAVVVVLGAAGYWYVKDHQRISQSSVQDKVSTSQNADGVVCVEKASHGRRWHCAGKIGDTSTCFNVVVDWRGGTAIKALKAGRCEGDEALKPVIAG